MLGLGVLHAGSCRLSVLPWQLVLVLASITWIPIRTQTGVTRCEQHFYQSLRILVVLRYAIPVVAVSTNVGNLRVECID